MNREHYETLSKQAKRIIDRASEDRAYERDISLAIDLVLGDRRFYPDVHLHPNETGVLVDPKTEQYVRFGAGGKGGGDFMGIFRRSDGIGLHIEAEVKRRNPRGEQSQDQLLREQLVSEFGGSYRVLRSVEDAERWIQELRGQS